MIAWAYVWYRKTAVRSSCWSRYWSQKPKHHGGGEGFKLYVQYDRGLYAKSLIAESVSHVTSRKYVSYMHTSVHMMIHAFFWAASCFARPRSCVTAKISSTPPNEVSIIRVGRKTFRLGLIVWALKFGAQIKWGPCIHVRVHIIAFDGKWQCHGPYGAHSVCVDFPRFPHFEKPFMYVCMYVAATYTLCQRGERI